jgi:hypothetical protein
MESLLSLAFDNISSVDATKIRKGLRQIEGLLAQICLSSAPARSPRKGGDGMAEAKGLGVLREDAAFREFFRLQEGFRCNGEHLMHCGDYAQTHTHTDGANSGLTAYRNPRAPTWYGRLL